MAWQEDGHEAAYETGFEQDLKFIPGKGVLGYCKIALAAALLFSESFGATLSYIMHLADLTPTLPFD